MADELREKIRNELNEELRERYRREINQELREQLRREISSEFESRRLRDLEESKSMTEKEVRIRLETQIRKDLEQEYVMKLEREAQARLNLQGDLLQKIKSEEQSRLVEEHKMAITQIERSITQERSDWTRKLHESSARQEQLEKAIISLRTDNVGSTDCRNG